ncbi:N-acetylmuramoyl-L-alanine amidase [Candidatus Saccharibacteria bacterium]|nr:N-acetylmuramoyl-L-alanine amidase [Candidatus Saccharibacteria bacterium]
MIFCFLFPQYVPALAESILDPVAHLEADLDDKEWFQYLPMFLRLFSAQLEPRYVSRALDRIAYGNPATLYLAFATLDPANQLANATKVARYLFNMKNEYYLAKFFFYWRRILGYTDHAEMNRMFFYQFNLTEEWLDEWLEGMRCEGRERIAKYKAMADTAGKPLLSPDSAIIRDRPGTTSPKFIVLHSAGAGSPVERICANFLAPDSTVTAHFVVSVDGRIFQLVDLKDAAKTNRTDNNPDMNTYYRFASHDFFRQCENNANNFTITIECEEFGAHGALSPSQHYKVLYLLKKLNEEYDIPIDEYHVIGHRDIAPLTRSFCPGSSFPLRQFIQEFPTWRKEVELLSARILSPAELI